MRPPRGTRRRTLLGEHRLAHGAPARLHQVLQRRLQRRQRVAVPAERVRARQEVGEEADLPMGEQGALDSSGALLPALPLLPLPLPPLPPPPLRLLQPPLLQPPLLLPQLPC